MSGRYFFALDFSLADKEKLYTLSSLIIPKFEYKFKVRKVPLNNLHLTILFVGDDLELLSRSLKIISRSYRTVPRYEFHINCFGTFNKKSEQVVWAGGDFSTLVADFFELNPSLVPHITLFRVKTDKMLNFSNKCNLSISPTALRLFKSLLTPSGAVYETIETLIDFKK
ncbi:MAG: hypothetical protein NZO16_02300 [Deltaproteobacteria bacterium]|nr:hypothetical protein [Deltaproteobacteria bacterium]